MPSSTKIRMKPPGSASASASPSSLHRLVLSPCAWRATAWSNHHFEPFIRPALCLHLPAPGFQQRERRGGVARGQVDPGLAEGSSCV